ncbi:Myo-inositol transporter 1 [Vanrija pseudolonga]|uniref:Myo-inositol transporter 1 n=1 Tax=Vanrija pseudolonga TaxID=143232 RepID=A0AAF0YD82_9TREE|nr:Myo-inositol transporter 1 [Vanrija pseudolonga]
MQPPGSGRGAYAPLPTAAPPLSPSAAAAAAGPSSPAFSPGSRTSSGRLTPNALGLHNPDELWDEPEDTAEEEEEDKDEVDEAAVVVPGEDDITPFVWTLVCAASLSGLLFGYDTGVISGTLVSIRHDLGHALSTREKELVTSATTLGALLGGLVAGALSDYVGRKGVLGLANGVFITGALAQACAHALPLMVGGRFVVGLGVGLASCIAPLYIGELAPTRQRGRLVTINAVACTLGQVLAYGIGAVLESTHGGWRWMVGLGAVPALVQLGALIFLPESPRILLVRGDVPAVRGVLARVYPRASPHDVERKTAIMAAAVRQAVLAEHSTTWTHRAASLIRVGANRRALVIGCGLQALQQLCGFNTLMYYSASIFASLGFKNATATGMVIALVNFAFTLVALRIIDPVGRRNTMLYTVPVMALALVLASAFFHQLTLPTDGVLVPGHPYPASLTTPVLLSMLLFVAAYATGCGNIPWQQGELFRLDVRGLGTSVCTATNWSCNLLVAATFLSLMESASPAGAFLLYAGACAAGWVFCWALYPETSGLSLEEVYEVFQDGFGVKKSQEMRAAKLARAQEAHRREA